MEQNMHHEELINGIYEQLKMVFDSSNQAIYLYLDDNHIICNKNFASLLKYKSIEELAAAYTKKPFLEVLVELKSQDTLVSAYRDAMENMAASCIKILWNKKSGGTVETNVILTPISYNGHLFALHFISGKK